MLNIYKYYDDAKTLPMYTELKVALALYGNPNAWDSSSRSILEPVEHIIAKNPNVAYRYALDVIKGRWPDAEPVIMKAPTVAYLYARNILRGRWPEAEPYIMKDPGNAFRYAWNIIKGRWPEAEPYLMKSPHQVLDYAQNVLAKDPEWTSQPGHENGRWPEAEPFIERHDYMWKQYKKQFGIE